MSAEVAPYKGCLATAQVYSDKGLCVLPVKADQSKAPDIITWTEYQKNRPTQSEIYRWFTSGNGIGLVCGRVSGNLEVIDFDDLSLFDPWSMAVDSSLPGLLATLPLDNHGHIFYKCDEISNNMKLAKSEPYLHPDGRVRPDTLIETRGEGGFIVVPPTTAAYHPKGRGYTMIRGDLANIPTITADQRSVLLTEATGFNKYIPEMHNAPTEPGANAGNRPGDLWAGNTSWASVLEPHGWKARPTRGETTYWQRPGKDGLGCSATTGHMGRDQLYVFSSNAYPFEDQKGYSKFTAYAMLNHRGDFPSATRAVVAMGYGDQPKHRTNATEDVEDAGEVKKAAQAKRSKTIAEHEEALAQLGRSFKLNKVTGKLEMNGIPMDDPSLASLRAIMRDMGFANSMALEDVLWHTGLKNEYHPIRDYLKKCAADYDGQDNISELVKYFTDITNPHPMFGTWLRRWMIGAVAKTIHNGDVHNAMLVLDGPQLTGKSYFASWLASELTGYFVQAGINPDDKDSFVRYGENFIWETGELGATTRRADIDALKDFISKETITLRRPYGKFDVKRPALASLIGTINNSGGFLADTTGNRRFMVAHIKSINWDYPTKIKVNQVWGEAVTAYNQGETWMPTAEERELSEANNEIYMLPNPLEGYLEKYFSIEPEDGLSWTSTGDIVAHLFEHGYRAQNSRGLAMEVASTLSRIGCKKYRKVTGNGFLWGYGGVVLK